jgi:XTP/dITP diphosphohydrolase
VAIPSPLALATRNPGKIREIQRICSDWNVEWVTDDGSWPEVAETGSTYLENAVAKARAIGEVTGLPALADDSGIEVDALGGEPGVSSAVYAGEKAGDEDNLRLLIERVAAYAPDARSARYRCIAVCAFPDGATVWTEGTCEGSLVQEPRGTEGFGYDPIFVPAGEERTVAELGNEWKAENSHRARAARDLLRAMRGQAPPASSQTPAGRSGTS